MNDVLTKKKILNTDIGIYKKISCGHEDEHPSAEKSLGLNLTSQPQKEPPMLIPASCG